MQTLVTDSTLRRTSLFTLLAILVSSPAPAEEFSAEALAYFETKVRPLLAEHCYECHSSRGKAPKAGLRVDSRGGLVAGGDSGPAIVPGKPEESLLIRAVTYLDPSLAMPPEKRLESRQVEELRAWIRRGAPWPGKARDQVDQEEESWNWDKLRREHWAWQPIERPALPVVNNESWPRGAIDRFVLRKLEEHGMEPAPPADRRTLIRRATFDLIGLPPTPAEVEAFVKDSRPGAFARVVDRLLASPHHGERWARHWLDVARYSDGMGSFLDPGERPGAYLYRDWVVRALNRDLPYDAFVKLQIAGDLIDKNEGEYAVGFLAVGPEYVSDGGTPLSILLSELETIDDRVDTVCRAILGITTSCARCHDHKFDPIPIEDYYSIAGVFRNTEVVERPMPWVSREEIERFETASELAGKASGELGAWLGKERERVQTALYLDSERYLLGVRSYDALRLKSETLPDTAEFAKSRGLFPQVFSRWLRLLADPGLRKRTPEFSEWLNLPPPTRTEDAPSAEARAMARRFAERVKVAFEEDRRFAEEFARNKEKIRKKLVLTREQRKKNRLIDELNEIVVVSKKSDILLSTFSPEKKKIYDELREASNRAKKKVPRKFASFHTVETRGSDDMQVLMRGDPRKAGAEAPQRFLRILAGAEPPRFKKERERLGLAEALVDPRYPLAARVMVNRVWLNHFGKALVRTPSNFGTLGEKPTHPELLDWLASEFVNGGWSLKELHRAIVLSSTYRMSSAHNEEHFTRDGANRLVWRMNVRRLDVEAWRDGLLAVTDGLERRMGGKPTRKLLDSSRRTLYTVVSRNRDRFESDEFLKLFDFPSPRLTNAQRTQSIVPQQYLFMMNSAFMIERARELAARLEQERPDNTSRIERAYELLFSRRPSTVEKQLGLDFLASTRERDLDKLNALEQYAQTLLSANGFLFIN